MKRLLLLFGALIMSVSMLMAQSSGDKLYNQGLQLQKTMTVKAQNSAIQKFTSAKKLYDSAAKKSQCDQAIAVSRNIISSLSSGGGKPTPGKKGKKNKTETEDPEIKVVESTLSLSDKEFNIDAATKALRVGVTTNAPEWSFIVLSPNDGDGFVEATKISDDELMISVAANNTTAERSQRIQVKAEKLAEDIVISQAGLPIQLEANIHEYICKAKGGNKKFTVSCNATQTYADNSYENWYVESKPEWVRVVIGEKKDKRKVEVLGRKLLGLDAVSADEKLPMVKSNVTLIVEPIAPQSRFAESGRKDEVVLRSGDQRLTIVVSEFGRAAVIY